MARLTPEQIKTKKAIAWALNDHSVNEIVRIGKFIDKLRTGEAHIDDVMKYIDNPSWMTDMLATVAWMASEATRFAMEDLGTPAWWDDRQKKKFSQWGDNK